MKAIVMRYSLLAALFAVAWGSAPSLSPAQFSSTGEGFIPSTTLNRFGLESAWTAQAVLNPSRDKVAHLVLDEELIYVQATNGIITAFDTETGVRAWAVRLGRFDEPSFPAESNETMVMVVVGTHLYAIEKRTGNIVWSLRLPGAPSTSPSADATQVYVGTLDGSVYAYSLKKIKELYGERKLPEWSHEALVWRYQAAKEITSPPLTAGRTVNFASRDGSVYAVSTERRELTFQFETDKPIVAPMAQWGDTQYLASEDFTFYAINATSGQVRWQFIAGLPIRTPPEVVRGNLYIHPDRGGLFCLDAVTGVQKWWLPRLQQFVAVANDIVFARDDNKDIIMVSAADGRTIGRLPTARFTRHVSNDRTDRIYLATDTGRIAALRFRGRDFPVYHKHPERLPLLPEFAPEVPGAPEVGLPGEAPATEPAP
ncbi:MAG TPA: PQQ-binding-like beta-propeller repeat protein [Planctomycetaceae bacterium]|nr:PQQ-binding-like beta-propeller repeat protein [Planctomycetaceae bacterium]